MSEHPRYGSAVDHRYRFVLTLGLAVLVADQWTKLLAVEHLTPGLANAALSERRVVSREEQAQVLDDLGLWRRLSLYYTAVESPCLANGRLCPEVKVFESFWSWRYVENKGAAWSMFARLPDLFRLPLLLGVSSLAVVFILAFVRKLEPGQTTLQVALGLVLGGAFGNIVDRAHFGYVVDFILWYYDDLYWPTFNVADVGISCGLGLILLTSLQDLWAARRGHAAETGVAKP
jgi:signal peptidase II